MKLVIIESPYAGDTERNIKYAKECMRDCFKKGEYPFASHLLYTQKGILDDDNPEDRELGIEASLEWGKHAHKTVVYLDYGVSDGMEQGIKAALHEAREIEYRKLY